jgi:hypothetical protein
LTALLSVATTTPVGAQSNGKQEAGEGKYANLTATWWQWVFAQQTVDVPSMIAPVTTNTNPLFDTTGEYATVGQENGIGPANKYFFLAGGGPSAITRTVTVPRGKALFFPIANTDVDNNTPLPATNYTVPQLRAQAKAQIDSIPVDSLFATLDDEPVEIFRTKSPTFQYTLPAENSFYAYLGLTFGITFAQLSGTVKPAVSDGYWAFIPALPSGFYVLHFGTPAFGQDMTYHITIK